MNGKPLSPSVSWRRLAALAGVAVAAAIFFGWEAGDMIVPSDPLPPRTNWTLAATPADSAAKDLAVLNERKPWTNAFAAAAAGAASQGSQPPKWRLAGLVERPGGNYALIAIGDPPEPTRYEYRAVGEKLPDGSTLIEIGHDTVTTQTGSADEKERVYRLFGGPDTSPASPSGPGGASPNKRAELGWHATARTPGMTARGEWVS